MVTIIAIISEFTNRLVMIFIVLIFSVSKQGWNSGIGTTSVASRFGCDDRNNNGANRAISANHVAFRGSCCSAKECRRLQTYHSVDWDTED